MTQLHQSTTQIYHRNNCVQLLIVDMALTLITECEHIKLPVFKVHL